MAWLLGILVCGIIFELGLRIGHWEERNERRWEK